MNHAGSTFLCGCSPFFDLIYFAKEVDVLSDNDECNSSFFVFDEQDKVDHWRKFDESVGWPAISMATIKTDQIDRLVVGISPQGDYWELKHLIPEEHVGKIKRFNGTLRSVSVIGHSFYTCGMDRVVLKRNGPGDWISIGPDAIENDADVVGFESIDGYSEDEIYAVGWQGEIWVREAGLWRSVDSPVNRILTSVHCASDGWVYIVGHEGVLIKGRLDQWEIIETDRPEVLRDVKYYNDTLYFVTDFRIFSNRSGSVQEVSDYVDDDRPSTCLHLLLGEDGLISLGQKDIFRIKDDTWSRLV